MSAELGTKPVDNEESINRNPNNKNDNNNNNNNRVAWEGCSVLIDINDGDKLTFARLNPRSNVKIRDTYLSLRPMVGCPFGSLFQVENGAEGPYLSRKFPLIEGDRAQENERSQIKDECKDNRAIIDNNTAQSLRGEDIEAMKSQGATGSEIVQALISNSATFEKKTEFSQEKYKLKKQKKYDAKVLLRRPFTRSICETYFKNNPAKIGFLRIDTLSLLLSMANVGAHCDILLVDMVGGILTGAVAERLGGTGLVCNTYMGVKPYSTDIVSLFNFGSETLKRIVRCPLSDLCPSETGPGVQVCEAENICNIKCESNEETKTSSINIDETIVSSENEMLDIIPEASSAPLTKAPKRPKAGEKASQEVINSWKENGFSSLIVAAPDADAWGVLKELIPLLSFSAPFAIYHQYVQPLATCMHNLQVGKMAVGLQISEPWLREYQVLPSRTHPLMQMSGFGGYILTGTKICSAESADQPKLK